MFTRIDSLKFFGIINPYHPHERMDTYKREKEIKMPIGIQSVKHLDGKLCFQLWARTGSVYKVPYVLANEYNLINEKNGKPYTSQAIWLVCNEYIINNLAEARPIFDQILKANGILPTDTLWYKFVIPKVKRLNGRKFDEYMITHSYLTPFLNIG